MQRAWSLAWRNLRRNQRRNVATVAAIALGYAGLVVLGGYATRVERFLRTNSVYLQHSGHVQVWLEGGRMKANAEPLRYQLDGEARAKVETWAAADPRVEFSAAYLRGMGLAGNSCATFPALLQGVEPRVLQRILEHPEVRAWSQDVAAPLKGKWLAAYPTVSHPVAVAAGLVELLKKTRVHDEAQGLPPAPDILHCDTPEEADEVARDASIQLLSLNYEGILSALDTEMVATFHCAEALCEDTAMTASLKTLQELFVTDRVTYVGLFLRNPAEAAHVARDAVQSLGAQGLKVEALPFDDERANPYYVGTMAFLNSMVGFITMLVTLVLVLTVLGAMTLTILERTRELGTWRALGFTQQTLTMLVIREALLLSVLGLALGLVLGLGAAAGINAANIRFSPPGVPGTIALLIYPSVMSCGLQASLLIPGVCLAAWVVVRKVMQQNVVGLLTAQSG